VDTERVILDLDHWQRLLGLLVQGQTDI